MKVADALKGVSRLYLDTAPVVYHFENNPSYHHLVAPIFERIDSDALQAAIQAAELRARYNMSLLDALQIGVALESNCDAILTNDDVFRRVTEIKVISVNDLEI